MICSRVRPALRGPGTSAVDAGRDLVERGPARAEEIQPPFQVRRGQDLDLDLRRDVRDAPEVGRARPGHALDHLDVARLRERLRQAGPLGHAGVPRRVGEQLLDRVVLRGAPAIESRPVHRARDDPAFLADLEDDPQRVAHAVGRLAALSGAPCCLALGLMRSSLILSRSARMASVLVSPALARRSSHRLVVDAHLDGPPLARRLSRRFPPGSGDRPTLPDQTAIAGSRVARDRPWTGSDDPGRPATSRGR